MQPTEKPNPIVINKWHLLHYVSDTPVRYLDRVRYTRDDTTTIIHGGKPPHKPSSTGSVYVADKPRDFDTVHFEQYYPAVFDLYWKYIE